MTSRKYFYNKIRNWLRFLLPAILLLHFTTLKSQSTCCCGTPQEMNFPGLDFEFGPLPPPLGYFYYLVGSPFGPWNVTQGAIDHGDPGYCGGLALGNPNGASYFIDLFGSPPGGSRVGSLEYLLFGLTPGYEYTVEFWYATFTSMGSFSANLKVANGAWLNVSWNANNPGNTIWLKKSYSFIAQSATAILAFTDTGASSATYQIGMLMDDIKIFECPADMEKPIVLNPPEDLEVECETQVPPLPRLLISDQCDANPGITLKESKEQIDPCTSKITREWTIKDACGNVTIEDQVIDIIDKTPARFTRLPENKIVYCGQDVRTAFDDWIAQHANARAEDDCGSVKWRNNYLRDPKVYCDTVPCEFIAINPCGQENSEFALFIVLDTTAPRFVLPAIDKSLGCINNPKDSLRDWLDHFGYAITAGDCDTVILSHNFDGDSTKNPVTLTFYAKDRCGNIDSSRASFSYRSGSDTFRITQYSCTFPQNTIDTAVFSVNGCDSIVITENIRRLADSTFMQFNSCDPQQPLFDTARLSNRFGCDSLVFSSYTLQTIPPTLIRNFDCKLSAFSTDTVLLQGRFCDSLVITENIPLRRDSSFILQSTCDSAKAGIQFLQLTNILGCDSIVTIQTDLSTQQVTALTLFECGLQTSYSDTVVFSAGNCDSLVVTTHIGLRTDTTAIFGASCDPSQTGNFRFQFVNRLGCDSIVLQTIALLPSDSVSLRKSTCILSEAGIDIQYLKNINGCDSIVTTRTDFLPSDTTFIQRNSCVLSEAGRDTLVFSTSNCDSVVFVQTNFVASDTLSIQQTTCDPNQVVQDTLTLQNRNGCDSIVYRNIRFVPLDLFLSTDSISCFGSNDGRLQILNWNQLKQPVKVYLNNQLIPFQQSIQNLAAGSYSLRIEDGGNCVSGELRFDVFEPTPLQIDLGPDLEAGYDETVRIPLTSNKALQQISWRPFACNNCSELLYKARQENWIYVEVLDENGCPASDSILVRVRQKTGVFAPNAFSPNGDNINDYFFIQGDPGMVVELLQIYDRWGGMVFETRNIPVNEPTAGWNGLFRGRQMNPGVFVYHARIKTTDSQALSLKGDLSLIK